MNDTVPEPARWRRVSECEGRESASIEISRNSDQSGKTKKTPVTVVGYFSLRILDQCDSFASYSSGVT
jgi:hypothetical protein